MIKLSEQDRTIVVNTAIRVLQLKDMAIVEKVNDLLSQNATEEKPLDGYARFLTVGNGVTLMRFAGKNTIHLAGRRKASDGNPNALFTIDIDKASRTADVRKDNARLFTICGSRVNYSRIEKLAISALHRWFKDQRPNSSTRRRKQKAKLAAMGKEVA